jgi:hypothetical protein
MSASSCSATGSPASAVSDSASAATGKQWSTCTFSRALLGMLGNKASLGSWTMVVPPRDLIAARPAVPSSSAPDRTMPITRSP